MYTNLKLKDSVKLVPRGENQKPSDEISGCSSTEVGTNCAGKDTSCVSKADCAGRDAPYINEVVDRRQPNDVRVDEGNFSHLFEAAIPEPETPRDFHEYVEDHKEEPETSTPLFDEGVKYDDEEPVNLAEFLPEDPIVPPGTEKVLTILPPNPVPEASVGYVDCVFRHADCLHKVINRDPPNHARVEKRTVHHDFNEILDCAGVELKADCAGKDAPCVGKADCAGRLAPCVHEFVDRRPPNDARVAQESIQILPPGASGTEDWCACESYAACASEDVPCVHEVIDRSPPMHKLVNIDRSPPSHVMVNSQDINIHPPNHAVINVDMSPPNNAIVEVDRRPPNHAVVNLNRGPPKDPVVKINLGPPNHAIVNVNRDPPNHAIVNANRNPPNNALVDVNRDPPNHARVNKRDLNRNCRSVSCSCGMNLPSLVRRKYDEVDQSPSSHAVFDIDRSPFNNPSTNIHI